MVDWLLKGEPRMVQLEALRRSYHGEALYEDKEGRTAPRRLPHYGQPAKGFGFFMQMRLGKTPTALNEFMLFRRDYGFKRAIMFCPNSYKQAWTMEAERFGVDVPAIFWSAPDHVKLAKKLEQTGGEFFLAVNYESLNHKPTLAILERWVDEQTYIGADESILIKNPSSIWTKNAIALAKECGARRPLTGKFISQGAQDLWSQLRFAAQISGVNFVVFRNAYCEMGGFKGKKVIGFKNEDRLHRILDNGAFVARRTEWLQTPGVDYAELPVEMIPEQRAHYRKMHEDFVTELDNGALITADQVIGKYIKLAQIGSGFIMDEYRKVHEIMPLASNPKVQALKKLIEDQFEYKAIVFVHHRHSVEMLKTALADYNPAFITGQQKNVEEQKHKFNSDPTCRIVIAQIQAVRFGHTLMGSPGDPCAYEVWFENNYSLNDRSQGEERPQGSGQEMPVTIFDMFCTPQERKVLEALQRKEDVAAAIQKYARHTGILPYSSDSE